MWKLPFALFAFGFSIGLACAQNQIAKIDPIALNKSKTTALATLSGEYLECSAYFSVTAYCMADYPAPAVTKIVRDYQDAAQTALKLATSADRVNNSSFNVRSRLFALAQMEPIKRNCLNISDLSERYHAFCNQLMQAPDRRMDELLTGKICTGLYKCALSGPSRPLAVSTRSSD
jgi:hypothetical protein